MNTSINAQALRLNIWAREYQDYLDSGLSQKAWCSLHGISASSFRYRRKQLLNNLNENEPAVNAPPMELPSPQFVAVPSPVSRECTTDSCVHLELDGRSVAFFVQTSGRRQIQMAEKKIGRS